MRRRALLAALASAGTLTAGCLDGGAPPAGDGTSDGTPTDTDGSTYADGPTDVESPPDADRPTDTETPAPTIGFSIEETTLQRGLVEPNTPDSIAVQHTDRSYLWMTVSVEGSPPERSAFAIEIPPKTYAPLAPDEHRAFRTGWDGEQYYDGTTGTALLLFELPYRVEGDAAYRLPAGRPPDGGSLLDRLEHEPPSMSATLQKRYAETPGKPVAVEATNEGDVTGRFLAAVNREGGGVAYAPIARVSALLDPGETRTIPVADPRMGEGTPTAGAGEEPNATYHLDWATGDDAVFFGQ